MHSSSLKRPLAILVTLMLALALPQQSMLAEKDKKEGKREAPVVDEKTGKRLNEAIEFLNQQKYNEARNALSGLNLEKLSPYERSRVEQIFASVEHSQGNYDKARTHFKAAMDAGGLNEQEISQIRYVIAQLYIAEERWKEGAAALEDWFKTAKSPNSAAYYLLAAAYYQMGDYKRALVPATKAIEITDKPQESWLQLVVALYLQQENYTATIPVLQRLIALAPNKKIYWSQLSSIYGEKEDYPNSLVMLQIPYNAGLLTEDSELRRLADLLMVTGMPYRAAQVLTKAQQQKQAKEDQLFFEKLSNCWIAAREFEKAVTPLETAAKMSKTGDLYTRLGETHVQLENWNAASEAFQNALNKGGLKDAGNANLLLGIALYNQKKGEEAVRSFKKAAATEKHRKMANSYIQLIESERKL